MPHRIKKDFRTLQARNTWISTMKSKGYNIKIEQYTKYPEFEKMVGYIFYCVKKVYMCIVKSLDHNFLNKTELCLDENNDTFYLTYIHPYIHEKNKLENSISNLLNEKKNVENPLWTSEWNDKLTLLNDIEKKIKCSDALKDVKTYNDKLIKNRIGISIEYKKIN